MNKEQVKGAVQEIVGKAQEEAGKLVGSKTQQLKGLGNQIAGKAEKNFGDTKALVNDAVKDAGKRD
jgi:uncharacterized protein YjbJ (UPF0337 family)